MFILDTRESELIKILGAAIEVRQLPVADIWIGVDPDTKTSLPEGIIAERKSIADLEAAKAKVEVCHKSQEGMTLFNYAVKLLNKFDCKNCKKVKSN